MKRKRNSRGELEKRGKKDPYTPSAILFVPRTKGGELARRLREKEVEIGKISLQRVKIVEGNGEKLENILTNTDPFGDEKYSRENCLTCKIDNKDRGRYGKMNLVYRISCKTCTRGG